MTCSVGVKCGRCQRSGGCAAWAPGKVASSGAPETVAVAFWGGRAAAARARLQRVLAWAGRPPGGEQWLRPGPTVHVADDVQ